MMLWEAKVMRMTHNTSESSLSVQWVLFLCYGRMANFFFRRVTFEVDRSAARVHQLGH